MSIAIDIIIVAVMAATVYKAAKKGFVVSLFSLVRVLLSLAVAFFFYKELGAYFNDTFVYASVKPYVFDYVEAAAVENGGVITAELLVSKLPAELASAVDTLGIDIKGVLGNIEGIPAAFASKLAVEISSAVAGVLAFAALFFATLILLAVLCFVLDIFAKLPILNGINKIFGFALGIVEAVLLGYVIAKLSLTVCSIYGAINNQPEIACVLDKTIIAKILITAFAA
ncbi:MAG: CvpA family protein [Clostridia bacterium]|nr:CvpA family protein [Clostridia bacterium]